MREKQRNPIEWLGEHLCVLFERLMPNPFLFAILLTFLVFGWGLLGPVLDPVDLGRRWMKGEVTMLEGGYRAVTGAGAMFEYWWKGFWSFLRFSMQMVLILVTGYTVAHHPRVRSILQRVASFPATTKSAVCLVAGVAMICSWVHWGLGLIVGAILARQIGEKAEEEGKPIHYPIVVAAGYSGLAMVWHWGLSASAPLLSAQTAEQGNAFFDVVGRTIPITETVLSPYALTLSGLSLVFTCLVYFLMAPGDDREIQTFGSFQHRMDDQAGEIEVEPQGEDADAQNALTFGERLSESRIIGVLLAMMGAGGAGIVVKNVITSGGMVTPDHINFFFLFLGILLYLRPARYMQAFYRSVRSSAGIILQFPFYAGIMGMIRGSGLSEVIAETLISWSSAETLPVVAWLTGGILNVFVPSGGGEWLLMGETMIRTAQEFNVPVGKVILSYGAGDQWTNLLQPFWAIPLLGICRVRARDVFGYTVTLMILSSVFYAIALTCVPYG